LTVTDTTPFKLQVFIKALKDQLRYHLKEKMKREARKQLGTVDLDDTLKERIESLVEDSMSDNQSTGEENSAKTNNAASGAIRHLLPMSLALRQIIDHAIDLRVSAERISSEMIRQPKPVDTFLADFAVEGQQFATSLTSSVVFSVGAIALRLVDEVSADIAATVLGFFSIGIAFGTMTNSARYINRHEESRIEFVDKILPSVKKGLFARMTADMRAQHYSQNPFIEQLDQQAESFKRRALYFGCSKEQINRFDFAYQEVARNRNSIENPKNIIAFMRQILVEFVADTFSLNSYLQEDLVNIYKTLHEMLALQSRADLVAVAGADKLFERVLELESTVEGTLQRGPISLGFIRKKPWYQWAVFIPFRHAGKAWLQLANDCEDRVKNVTTSSARLQREILYMEEFSSATKESEVTTLVYLNAAFVLWISALFTTFRLLALARPEDPLTGLPEEAWVAVLLNATATASSE
jgi:hypothetical protein